MRAIIERNNIAPGALYHMKELFKGFLEVKTALLYVMPKVFDDVPNITPIKESAKIEYCGGQDDMGGT